MLFSFPPLLIDPGFTLALEHLDRRSAQNNPVVRPSMRSMPLTMVVGRPAEAHLFVTRPGSSTYAEATSDEPRQAGGDLGGNKSSCDSGLIDDCPIQVRPKYQ